METQCDLVLLTWNHLEVTQRCLKSIFQYTDIPSRLLIVDNGSDQPGAAEYLKTIKPERAVREVVCLRNEADYGFAKGMNRGLGYVLEHQPANYICVISNDVVMTSGWLTELTRIAAARPDIGFVNPLSTNFGFYPDQGVDINKYGLDVTRSGKGRWRELGSCVGFCFLTKKEVLEKTGLFDEIYGMAYYEDADLSKKAQSAGYRCVLAEGSYVYHEQGKSFGKGQEKSPLFLKNEEIFYSRWNMPRPRRILYLLKNSSGEKRRQLSEEIRRLANQFSKVWVLDAANGEVPNHWNVQKIFYAGPSLMFALRALIYLFFKKKKFDTVFVDDSDLVGFLKKTQKRYREEFKIIPWR